MVHEAIVVLADRTGSSVPAIQKFMKATHSELLGTKPKAFNTAVYSAIKAGVKEGKLVKVKCSYKINRNWVEKEKSAYRAKEAKKKAMERKKKKEATEKALKLKQQKLEAEQKKKVEAALTADEKAQLEKVVSFLNCACGTPCYSTNNLICLSLPGIIVMIRNWAQKR
jgi:histone H1/5